MALRDLDVGEMVGWTAMWVGAYRPQLEGIPQVAGWLPQLEEVHQRIVKVRPASSSEHEAEVSKITAQELVIDVEHDDLVRLTDQLLEVEQLVCRVRKPARPERAARCEEARGLLLPRGLGVVKTLYVTEAGYAERARQLLASEAWLRELLASIPVSDGSTLLAVVERWIALGGQLRELEEKKLSLQARQEGGPQAPKAEILAARNAWLSIVNAILMNLSLVEGHDEAVAMLRAPAQRFLDNADRRAAQRGGAQGEGEDEDGDPPPPARPATPAEPIEPGMPGAKPFI